MRTAITIGILPSGSAKLLAGPEVPVLEQRNNLKHRRIDTTGFSEVQVWESDGITMRIRPEAEAARAARQAARNPPTAKPNPAKLAQPDYAAELSKLDDSKLLEVAAAFDIEIQEGVKIGVGLSRADLTGEILRRNAALERAST